MQSELHEKLCSGLSSQESDLLKDLWHSIYHKEIKDDVWNQGGSLFGYTLRSRVVRCPRIRHYIPGESIGDTGSLGHYPSLQRNIVILADG